VRARCREFWKSESVDYAVGEPPVRENFPNGTRLAVVLSFLSEIGPDRFISMTDELPAGGFDTVTRVYYWGTN
jgi:hypothetical protein